MISHQWTCDGCICPTMTAPVDVSIGWQQLAGSQLQRGARNQPVSCQLHEGTYHRGLGLDDQVWWSFNNVQFWLIFCWHKICQLTHVKTSSADHQQNICFPFYFLHPPSNIIKSYIYPKTSLRLYSFFAVSDCSIDSLTMTDSKGMFVDLCPTSHDC